MEMVDEKRIKRLSNAGLSAKHVFAFDTRVSQSISCGEANVDMRSPIHASRWLSDIYTSRDEDQ